MKGRLPDFIIGGAPRSGTTWLYHLLDKHPEIYMAKPVKPEPKFFLIDEIYKRGIEYYKETWFSNVDPNRIAGEKTTNYLESSVAAARIYRHLPRVKLVFILREPAQRAFSNYLWTKMNGLEKEDFATAIALETQRERTLPEKYRFSRPYSYFSRGLYADLLRPYFERFPREQIVCLRYEEIAGRPHELAAQLHRFLGVVERSEDVAGLGTINASEKVGAEIPADVYHELVRRYQEPNRKLAALLGPEFEIWTT
ncbi:MAG TPA: sulfotransferase [Candidatus Binataceae bacterium]|nr:sulfotransferase [Candidatus Binataceae bacterium]